MLVDEEAALAPLTPPSQAEYQASSAFPTNPISQLYFFPLVTFEVCLVYANFWYAMAQIQTLTGQGQNLMPSSTAIA